MTEIEQANTRRQEMKEKVVEELKAYWVIVIYLALFLAALTTYRRLILAEFGVTYVHYGVAVVEAMVIAKVILIGKMFGFTRRLDDKPLVWPVLFKSIVFGVFVFIFGVLEHLVEGLVHREGLAASVHRILAIGGYELSARMLILTIAFVPFFAFWELGRVVGLKRLAALYFTTPDALEQTRRTGS